MKTIKLHLNPSVYNGGSEGIELSAQEEALLKKSLRSKILGYYPEFEVEVLAPRPDFIDPDDEVEGWEVFVENSEITQRQRKKIAEKVQTLADNTFVYSEWWSE
jgi:hypothetical protein